MPDGTTDKLIFEELKALLEQLRKAIIGVRVKLNLKALGFEVFLF